MLKQPRCMYGFSVAWALLGLAGCLCALHVVFHFCSTELGSWFAWPGAKKTNKAFLKCLDTWHSFMWPLDVADVAF